MFNLYYSENGNMKAQPLTFLFQMPHFIIRNATLQVLSSVAFRMIKCGIYPPYPTASY